MELQTFVAPAKFCFRNAFIGMLAGGLLAMAGGCATVPAEDAKASADRAKAVVASEFRTDNDRKMDASRRPEQFLPFTGVKPGMKVLDWIAGGGFTSQLLALAVGPEGKVWAQSGNPGAVLTKRLADRPQANIAIAKRPLDDPVPEDAGPLDLVTTVNNYHDLACSPADRPKVLQKLFAALKPGGRFVVVDHSGKPGTGITECKTLHRIEETVVLAEVTAAGFVLEEKGEFLRNPADARDGHSGQLPIPSDKFAFRFVKPR